MGWDSWCAIGVQSPFLILSIQQVSTLSFLLGGGYSNEFK